MIHVIHADPDSRNRGVLDLIGELGCADCPRLRDYLAGGHIQHVLRKFESADPVPQHQLLVVLVASDPRKIIASRIEEQIMHLLLGGIDRQRFARPDLLVQLQKTLGVIARRVLREAGLDLRLIAEKIDDLLIRSDAERADQHRDRHLSRAVDADVEGVVGIRLVFQPGAAVRNHRAGIELLSRFIVRNIVINAGGTNELGHDDTLRSIYDEGAGVRHQGKGAHVFLMLLDLPVFLVVKANGHLERRLEVGVTLLAFIDRVFDFIPAEPVAHEFETQLVGEILDGGDVIKDLL